jgi:hypothetical protein
MTYLAKAEPAADAQGIATSMDANRSGLTCDFLPTLTMDRQEITLSFMTELIPSIHLRQMTLPMTPGTAPIKTKSEGTVTGTVKMSATPPPATQPATAAPKPTPTEGVIDAKLTGTTATPAHRAEGDVSVTLETPEQDVFSFLSAVRIPNNGAAVFAASSRTTKATAEPDTEVILFLRAKSAN